MRSVLYITPLVIVLSLSSVGADSARHYLDYFYIPPAPQEESEESVHEKKFAIPNTVVLQYLQMEHPIYVIEDFSEQQTTTKQLREQAPSHQVAFGKYVNIHSNVLFDGPVPRSDGPGYLFLGSISSVDAYALRLKVIMNYLEGDESLYLIDRQGRAALGPFTKQQGDDDGTWLPTMLGDTVQLALFSSRNVCPLIQVTVVSHFFKSIFLNNSTGILSCNIPAGDETNLDAKNVATGVGVLIIPYGQTNQGFCTGTLLNTLSPDETPPPPYLISAWHCFEGATDYSGVEVYWDYRSESDSRYDLHNTRGAVLIAYNATLDAALIKLTEQVQPGPYGRAWVGWDTITLAKNDPIQVFHHPQAYSLKTSRGVVTQTSVTICQNSFCLSSYQRQIEVHWQEGVTEQGSSGSPLLHRGEKYRIIGMLSNGPLHSCTNSSGNNDNFGSFATFFPEIKCHLLPGEVCEDPFKGSSGSCFLVKLFDLETTTLENLYQIRDKVLSRTSLGKQLIQDYYALCPTLEQWLKNDSAARVIMRGIIGLNDMASLFLNSR